jgi:glycosyltransferase involved in cell wall biosynthesis
MSGPGTTDVAVFVPGLRAGGGAEKTALVTAESLARAGLAVSCFTDSTVSRAELREHFGLELAGVDLRSLPTPTIPDRLPRSLQDLVRDRAHAKAIRSCAPTLFINMKFKSELPGLGAHNWYYTHFPHRLRVQSRSPLHTAYLRLVTTVRRALLHRGAARFIDTYDLTLANSQFTREHVRQRWGVDATVLYPPCADTLATSDRDRDRDRTILNVGRFQADGPNIPHKRQDVLVDSFARMPDLIADGWSLHLVGAVGSSPADRAYLDHVRELARGLPVTIHENAPHAVLTELHGRACIYWHAQGYGTDGALHPEAQEHFGISTVEAMAAGIVPIVYATAGPAEVVQDEYDLTWRTPEELAARTRALLDPDRWSRWHSRCQQRATEFTTLAFTEHVVQFYLDHCGPLPTPERGRG